MDKEPDDWQSLTFVDIVTEPFKLIGRHAKLFSALTFTLILPLCFLLLGHNLVAEPLIHRIHRDEEVVSVFQGDGFTGRVQKELDLERVKLLGFFMLYTVFVLAFSLLSTAAVVYSIACIYSGRRVSYAGVLKVVPSVWKRLLITFVWVYLFLFIYQVLGFLFIFLGLVVLLNINSMLLLFVFLSIVFIAFSVGFVYLNCIWQLASVISVLEESFGIMAMRKSSYLIRGMRLAGFFFFLIYLLLTLLIGTGFNVLVVHSSGGTLPRVWYGILFILLLSLVNLVGMVLQTIFYFACKSQHHESIDKLALSEHLGAYLGEYMPLKSSIQMEAVEP